MVPVDERGFAERIPPIQPFLTIGEPFLVKPGQKVALLILTGAVRGRGRLRVDRGAVVGRETQYTGSLR